MRLLRKVKPIDAKRAFTKTHLLRKFGIAGKRDVTIPTKTRYLKAQSKVNNVFKKLNEKQLDRYISSKKRLTAYNSVDWCIGEVEVKKIGVWKKAGGLPKEWTDNSLAYTARLVKKGLENKDKRIRKRSRRVLPIIMLFEKIIKRDKYSLPVIFQRKVSPVKRRGLKKMPFEIDDGNMRAIAFAMKGDKKIKAYVGVKKKKVKA